MMLKLQKSTPPKVAQKLLLRFLRDDLAEEVLGDLEEKFFSDIKNKSPFRAKLNYWYQVFNYVRPFALRKSQPTSSNYYSMFQNYFKISIRNLLKQKLYSVVNIGGLTLGLTCFLLISLYVQHEFSYDRFFENSESIYRIYQRQAGNISMGSDYFANTPAKLASILNEGYPEVEHATSVVNHSALLSNGENHFLESGLWVDQHFFDVFPYPLKHGNIQKLWSDPKSIVLTESLAFKIFGDEDPVGNTLVHKSGDNFTVTGVMFDPPATSSIKFTFLINIQSNPSFMEEVSRSNWNGNSVYTFIQLARGRNPHELETKFPDLLKKYRDPEAYSNYPFKDEYIIQNLPEIHLQTNVNGDIGIKGNPTYVLIFSITALLVLFLACVNYMNLAIARSIRRAREVGLRKVVGAMRGQLIGQFLQESVLISLIALPLAILLTHLLLPAFGAIIERPLELNFQTNRFLFPGLPLLVIIVGLISGSYPAFVMSALRPIHVLKGKIEGTLSGFRLQRLLIVMQYVVSTVLIISSLVIYRQLRFVRQKELGFDREHVVVINSRHLMKDYEVIRNEFLQYATVTSVTASTDLPANITSSTIINDEDGSGREDDLAIYRASADPDFLKVFGIKLIAGRNFLSENPKDSEDGYLINEKAAKALGWTPVEAVGKELAYDGPAKVIGVVKDFHMHSMHLPIQPLMIGMGYNYARYISVKILPENLPETISFLERTTKKYSSYPFEYQFLDAYFDQLYKADENFKEIFGFFTAISILIASLGLFGLAAFMAGQRTREIGIRKVLGASMQNILSLLTGDFMVLIVIAFFVSIPIAWYTMHAWLQNFAYRIEMEWWMFALAGVFTLIIANITIGYQSIRASLMDPVNSLRSE